MKRFWALTFVLLLLTPAAAWVAGLDVDLHLRRTGYELPRPAARALLQRDYYLALDRYFNESLALRDPLVWGKNWLDRYLFQASDDPEVYLGRDGWLFRRRDVLDHRADGRRDPAAIQRLLLELRAVEELTEASGRRFVFAVAPSKAALYPEHLGWAVAAAGAVPSAYDQLRQAMQENPLPGFLLLDDWMQANKLDNRLLYDKDGAFWNRRGAAVAAEAWYRHMFAANTIRPVLSGGRAPGDDLTLALMARQPTAAAGGLRRFAGGMPSAWGQTLLYDSGAAGYLIDHLKAFVPRLDVVEGLAWPSKVGENPRDYDSLMFLVAEAEVDEVRIDFDRIAPQLEGEASQALRSPVARQGWHPLAQAAVQDSPAGLTLKSMGGTSQFQMDGLAGSDAAAFRILKLQLTGLQADRMLFTFDQPQTLELERAAQSGQFTCYLPLPFATRVDLRWQPGTRPGLIALRRMEIIALPRQDIYQAVLRGVPARKARGAPRRVKPAAPTTADGPRERLASLADKAPARPGTAAISAPAPRGPGMAAPDPAAATDAAVIQLNDIAEGRIFQRQGRSAAIVVSGTWQGRVTGIEARVVRADDQRQVVPWTLVDAAPQNGLFLGTLPVVPQGGWYQLQVRERGRPAQWIRGVHRWGVGLLVACLGQSNMQEWFYAGSDLEAHPLLRMHNPDGWSALGRNGNGAIAFGNRLAEELGLPVGLLDYAVNGSGLLRESDWGTGYWEDRNPGAIYERFRDAAAALGGALEMVVWIQGEADAARGTVTREAYAAGLERLIARQLRADVRNASARPQLPVLIVSLMRRPGGKDGPHQAVREAQQWVARRLPECYLAATTLDLELMGRQHLTPESYRIMGRRVAQTALFVLGRAAYYRGPRLASIQWVDGATLDFVLRHDGGSDILPQGAFSGWQITQEGRPCAIASVERHDARTVRLTLARALDGPATASYLYGAMPDVQRAVYDNSPLHLPLEAFRIEVPPRALQARTAR